MATTITGQNFGTANVIVATENAANISIAINYTPFLSNISNSISAIAANIAFIASNVSDINANLYSLRSSVSDINANIFSLNTNVAGINSNTVNTSSSTSDVIQYWSNLVLNISNLTSKVASIESMAFGDHGIHTRQPHQWAGGSATFTSEANVAGNPVQTTSVTLTNISE